MPMEKLNYGTLQLERKSDATSGEEYAHRYFSIRIALSLYVSLKIMSKSN